MSSLASCLTLTALKSLKNKVQLLPETITFTPAEASQTLPLVKKIVTDILSNGNKLKALYEIENDQNAAKESIRKEMDDLYTELQSIGCDYKDWSFDIGLVDFPSEINGQQVYLCWKSDEPSLLYYHGITEGFAGRKLIPQNLLS
jgi:hypothetical protein